MSYYNCQALHLHFFFTELDKLLSKIAKKKGFEPIKEWIKACKNHFHWSATSTHDGNGDVIYAKFKTFLSHVVDKHVELEDPLFNKCAHGEIGPKKWLTKGLFFFKKNVIGTRITYHIEFATNLHYSTYL